MRARFFRLAAVLLLACGPLAAALGADNPAAPSRPVSVQELSLLLRSGYTGDEVLNEIAGRPLLAPIDAAAERALLDAGANARTIATLRNNRPVASQTEAADAQQRQAAADQYRLDAWEADQTRRAEAGRQAVNDKLAARRDEQFKQVSTHLRDKLVIYQHDRLEPSDSAALAGKRIFLFYAAAGSDRGSHILTPQLVEFYKKFAPAHPDFELVLVSADRSAADLEQHMKNERMPWPALAFDQIAQQPDLAALCKNGLPRLMLIDGSARAIADSFESGKPPDMNRVLNALVNVTNSKQAVR